MLDELKKLSQLGRREDILFFLRTIIGVKQLSEKDIRTICTYSSGGYQLDVDSLLAYCAYLQLIERHDAVRLSEDVITYINDAEQLNEFIIRRTIIRLFEDKLFTADMFVFDIRHERFTFRNEYLPLSYAPLRNTLISQGLFEVYRDFSNTEFFIHDQYEKLIASFCRQKKGTIGIDQLKKKLEANVQAGENAERYVLEYEKKRISDPVLTEKIKIISDIDVCAGYDIISFNTPQSYNYDRFIEVKAISYSSSFYFSANEFNTAKLKGTQYYLYLIDLKQIHRESYIPVIIKNPANIIFASDDWLVEPQSFHIWHV
ncbi:DUF3883 domain-containing protein [Oscillospiraceae bacterium OttesenSCG-928-F05]|nr:DUF3883 domain-containing protein [Oscillospiraceae bacterium OttesenSCG-928-F05]